MKLRIEVEGRSYEVNVDFPDDGAPAEPVAEEPEIEIPAPVLAPRPPQKLLEDTFCRSPIAGKVSAVVSSPGQKIRKNEPVVVLEAMKMEVQIGPSVDGTVKSIHVKPGQAVGSGQLLFELA